MAEYPDLYNRAFDTVIKEQDQYLSGIRPGKNRQPQLSEDELAERYQRLIAGRPERLLRLAYRAMQREGLEPTAEEIAKRALEFGQRMDKRLGGS